MKCKMEMMAKCWLLIMFLICATVFPSSAQDIEQLTKADLVSWSGGLTWSKQRKLNFLSLKYVFFKHF